jgi:hypothetical protein
VGRGGAASSSTTLEMVGSKRYMLCSSLLNVAAR